MKLRGLLFMDLPGEGVNCSSFRLYGRYGPDYVLLPTLGPLKSNRRDVASPWRYATGDVVEEFQDDQMLARVMSENAATYSWSLAWCNHDWETPLLMKSV